MPPKDGTVGVVMASMGRAALLRATLTSLFDSEFAGPLVVVEQGVRTSTARKYLETLPLTAILLDDNYGKGYAWNVGLSFLTEACYVVPAGCPPDYVLLCDDDLTFSHEWESTMVATLERFYPTGLRALSGFRHSSQEEARVFDAGPLQVVEGGVRPFVPGCCLLMRFDDAMRFGHPFPTDRLIGDVEGAVMRRIHHEGFWCASTTTSLIDHAGSKQRSWHPGTKRPRRLIVDKPDEGL